MGLYLWCRMFVRDSWLTGPMVQLSAGNGGHCSAHSDDGRSCGGQKQPWKKSSSAMSRLSWRWSASIHSSMSKWRTNECLAAWTSRGKVRSRRILYFIKDCVSHHTNCSLLRLLIQYPPNTFYGYKYLGSMIDSILTWTPDTLARYIKPQRQKLRHQRRQINTDTSLYNFYTKWGDFCRPVPGGGGGEEIVSPKFEYAGQGDEDGQEN